MASNRLFDELCSPPVVRVGWHLAQADSRDDFVIDPVGYADFASNLPARIEHLIEQIQQHRYRPRHLLEIDLPKTGLSVRPGNVLPIEEATLLNAIVYLLAPLLDRKLHRSVYSYRLHPDWKKRVKKRDTLFREAQIEMPFLKKKTVRAINPFEAWYECWPAFDADSRRACTEEGYTHLTKTDISAYFENIDLRLLETEMRSLLRRDEGLILRLLFRILDGWTRATSTGTPIGRGIPQGNDVSSFLGNLYLIPLDRALIDFCRRRDAKWFRYVDDVKVFTRSERDAREAVFVVNRALRSLHLNLQGSKTQILSGQQLETELDNSEDERVNQASDAVRKLLGKKGTTRGQITTELRKVFDLASRFRRNVPQSIKHLSSKNHRLFRRLMTLFGTCERPHFRTAAFAALRELPDMRILNKSLSYLAQLPPQTHRDTFDQLMTLVEGDELPFPYQVAMVLELLADLHPVQPLQDASRIRQYGLTAKRHWLVVQKALEAVFTYPYRARHAQSISERFLQYGHPLVRRAACVVLLRAPAGHVRSRLSELIYHPDHSLSSLAMYFRRFVQDVDVVHQEMSRIKHANKTEFAFLKMLPQMYAMAASQDALVAHEVQQCLTSWPRFRSEKIAWHRAELSALTKWALTPAIAGAAEAIPAA